MKNEVTMEGNVTFYSIVFCFCFSESTESRIRIFGVVEGWNSQKVWERAKTNKKTYVFQFDGAVEGGNFETFLWNLGRFLKILRKSKKKQTFSIWWGRWRWKFLGPLKMGILGPLKVEILGPLKVENFGTAESWKFWGRWKLKILGSAEGTNFQKFCLKFRVIFEN